MQQFNMGQVPSVTFGNGRITKVPSMAARLGQGPVLIIADAILEDLGMTDMLTQALSAKGMPFELAATVSGEPKEALVDDLCVQARELGAAVIVGLGGGAAMDAAKLTAAIARSGQNAASFALAAQPLPVDGIPAIAIPTTAGTGSEVTRTSVISRADGSKIWFWGEELMFSQAVLDPQLTLSLPPQITAWTGIDAVAHALEGATSSNTSPAGQLYGLEALRVLTDDLPKVVSDGANLEARGRVLWASLVAGLALHNCNTHMGHNISHALGSLVRIHHGLATGLALEASLPWLTARPEGAANYAAASKAMGGAENAEALPGALSALMRASGIAAELPAECASVSAEELAVEMKNDANIGMAQNSACPVTASDIDEMAGLMMQTPVAAAA
ncbi:MAG: iron-containing alcohol dehydrogenase [Pseudomonadota bacterium]